MHMDLHGLLQSVLQENESKRKEKKGIGGNFKSNKIIKVREGVPILRMKRCSTKNKSNVYKQPRPSKVV